jgi:hypothetical protein
VNGLGTVTSAGLYTAPASGSGSSYVLPSVGTVANSAKVSYAPLTSDIWTGLGSTSNWSDPNNWSAKVVPNSGTAVNFNGTTSKPSIVDPAFAGSVASVQITSVFSGSITLGRSLSVAGTFSQAGGTYNANGNITSVTGVTTLYIGSYLASTATQYFIGGLTLQGGALQGSTGNILAGSVTISSGTLNAPSATLYVNGGNFTYSGGAFNPDGGTVEYIGTNVSPLVSVGTGLIRFYNFIDDLNDTYPAYLTISGTLTTTGTFSWLVSASAITGNIEAQGNVDDENHGGIGNPYLTLDGAANQAIEDLSGVGGGQFRTIAINKSGGTVSLACNPIDFSGLTLTAGQVNIGSHSWYVAGPFSAAAGLNLGNVTVDGPGATVVGTSIQLANVTFASSSVKLTAPTGSLYVSGNWNDAVGAAIALNGSTVTFDGGSSVQQLNSGGQSFYNMTVLAGSSVILESDVTVLNTLYLFGTIEANGHKLIVH